jgi:hypothetical protein
MLSPSSNPACPADERGRRSERWREIVGEFLGGTFVAIVQSPVPQLPSQAVQRHDQHEHVVGVGRLQNLIGDIDRRQIALDARHLFGRQAGRLPELVGLVQVLGSEVAGSVMARPVAVSPWGISVRHEFPLEWDDVLRCCERGKGAGRG